MDIGSMRLVRLHSELGDIVYELTRVRFSQCTRPAAWHPAINAYRCEDSIVVCLDLAGVDKSSIDLQVEPSHLLIQGHRELPQPSRDYPKPVQVLAMEIDHGDFRRELTLPKEVDAGRVTAEQKNGLLWIFLPLRPHA